MRVVLPLHLTYVEGLLLFGTKCIKKDCHLHLTYVEGLLLLKREKRLNCMLLHLTYVEGLLPSNCRNHSNSQNLHLTRPRTKNRSSQKGRSGQTFSAIIAKL